jgi:hypothetical protein
MKLTIKVSLDPNQPNILRLFKEGDEQYEGVATMDLDETSAITLLKVYRMLKSDMDNMLQELYDTWNAIHWLERHRNEGE